MPEFVLVYGVGEDPWWIIESETGEVVDRFRDEVIARETLSDWL